MSNVDLFASVERGSVEEVRTALRQPGVDVNCRGGKSRNTALCEAIEGKNLEIFHVLVEQPNIDVNAGDKDGNNPLHLAAIFDIIEIAGRLIEHPAIDINRHSITDKSTPLGKAAYRNRVEIVDFLLRQPTIDPNAGDKDRDTPLHYAAIKGNVEIARQLVEHPAINLNALNDSKETALDKAIEIGHVEIVILLIQQPDIHITTRNVTKSKHLVTQKGYFELINLLLRNSTVEISAENLVDYMLIACANGDANAARLLRDRPNSPFDINSPRGGGQITALHMAVNSGKEDVLEVLLEMPNIVLDFAAGFEKFTPLHVAAQRGNDFAVESILRIHRQKMSVVDTRSPLASINENVIQEKINVSNSAVNMDRSMARSESNNSNVDHAIARNDANDINVDQSTAGNDSKVANMDPSMAGSNEVASNAVDQSTELHNARDVLARTPLHYAAWNNGVAVVEQLLKEDSLEVNAVDLDGYTPLYLASKNGHVRIVELLLSNDDTDPNATCKSSEEIRDLTEDEDDPISQVLGLPKLEAKWFDGAHPKWTPLHCALEEGNIEVVQCLLARSVIHEDEYLGNGDHKSIFHVAIRRGVLLQELVQKANVQSDGMLNLIRHLTNCAKDVGTEEAWNMLTFLWEKIQQTVRLQVYPQITTERSGIALTLLHELAWAGLDEWMEAVLIYPGWPINALDIHGQTPLHYATLQKHTEIVEKLLLYPGLDINVVDSSNKWTPLQYAASQGQKKVVQVLLSSKLPLRANEEDKKGRSALQIAVEEIAAKEEESKKDIEKLLLARDEVSKYVDRLYRDRQVHVDAANAILVGAALIASVTFGGWLQPPLGFTPYYEFGVHDPAAPPGTYESYAAIKQHRSIRIFWACNSLSFFLAIATVISGAWAVLPSENLFIKEEVRMVRRSLVLTSVLLVFAIAFVLGAFGASGFASLPPILSLETNMIVTCCIGVGICVIMLALFLVKLYKIRPSWMRSDKWRSLYQKRPSWMRSL